MQWQRPVYSRWAAANKLNGSSRELLQSSKGHAIYDRRRVYSVAPASAEERTGAGISLGFYRRKYDLDVVLWRYK